jgi:hypothetical protein
LPRERGLSPSPSLPLSPSAIKNENPSMRAGHRQDLPELRSRRLGGSQT